MGQNKDRLQDTQRLPDITMERDRAWLKVHRLKTEWMGPCTGFDLSMLMFCAERAVLDMSKLRGWRFVTDVDDLPYRFQRAMKLDSRLRNLLTKSYKGEISQERVVTLLDEILGFYLDDDFTDEDQNCRDGGSFDLSKYKDGLKEEHLFLLFQLSKYIDCCACIPHLGIKCSCGIREGFVELRESLSAEETYELDKVPEFEFVSWHKYGFPLSVTTITGHVCEAKQRVFSELEGSFGDKKQLTDAINAGFGPVVDFMKEYAKVGWECVPKDKLMAGLKLEKAYQQLARVNAVALAGISGLNVRGIVMEATAALEKSFITYVNKKNSSLAEDEEPHSKGREALWDFIFDSQEGIPLRTIMMGEYVYGPWEGLDFSTDILRKKIPAQRLMEGDKPVGVIVSDSDYSYEELNFLQALCKFVVVKLQVVSQDKILYFI